MYRSRKQIEIIINHIYNNPFLPILKINPNILHKLLICTTFYNPNGEIYTQIDGNFYMSNLESKMFNDVKKNTYMSAILVSLFSLRILKNF